MFGRSNASFDRLLEKATSQLLLEPDWTSTMMICDTIRQGDTNPKYAVTAIKKKFYHTNPHVALYALQVMESCVKNCGSLVHDEIANTQFMEELREMVKNSTDENIKNKVLELLQTWGMAFRNSPKYRIVTDTLNLMKAEGWKFPPVREAEAMFEADTAPDWAEGDVCHRCRVQFSTFTRQHHCRACGQVFCGKCSSKFCVLPKFGIEKEVRTCDSCFEKYGPKDEGSPTGQEPGTLRVKKERQESESDLPAEYLASPLSKQPQVPENKAGGKTEAELREEEEFQLALAISQSEAEEKEKAKKKATSEILSSLSNNTVTNGANGNGTNGAASVGKGMMEDPPINPGQAGELEKYLNRDYWEQRERQDLVSAGQAKTNILMASGAGAPVAMVTQEVMQGSNPDSRALEEELNEFTETLKTQLEIFVNRMKSNSSRGRPIANDTSVQTLFMNIMTMHGKLVRYIQDQEDHRVKYEGLQDKLTQIKDARAALDALREEELERKRQEQEELERQRQIQLAAKLEVMRKKKAEYLEYQRQLALQRMAEQEREVASKAMYMPQPGPGMYGMAGGMPPNMYMPQQYPGMMHPGGAPMPGPGQMYPGYQMPPGQPGPGDQHQAQGGQPHGQPQAQPPQMAPGASVQQSMAPGPQSMAPATQTMTSMAPQGMTEQQQQGAFNMSGMAGALPQYMMSPPQQQQQQPMMSQQQQPMMSQQQQPPMYGAPGMMPPPHQMMGQPPMQHHLQSQPQQQQQQPGQQQQIPQPEAPAASLIEF